jgi:uncharacterized membrane protein
VDYHQLAYLHLATVLPAFVLGTIQLARPKGTRPHALMGRVYTVLLVVTAAVSLFMPARVGPQFFGHFGFIHILSVLTLVAAPAAVIAARHGWMRTHRSAMIAQYVGAILIAGGFAFMPGRMLHGWLFGAG